MYQYQEQQSNIENVERKVIDFSFDPVTQNYNITYSDGVRVSNCMKQPNNSVCNRINAILEPILYGEQPPKKIRKFDPYTEEVDEELIKIQNTKQRNNLDISTFLSLLKSDVIFKYAQPNCKLTNQMGFLTDYFYNLKNNFNIKTMLFDQTILVCYNLFDYNYLQYLKINSVLNTYVTPECTKCAVTTGDDANKMYIDMNPIQANCRPAIYTIVPLNTRNIKFNSLFLYELNKITIVDDDWINNDTQEINMDLIINATQTDNVQINDVILTINPTIESENTFKLMLMGLHLNDLTITKRLYNHVYKYMSKYRNYRAISVNDYECSNISKIYRQHENIDKTADFLNIYTKKGFKIY